MDTMDTTEKEIDPANKKKTLETTIKENLPITTTDQATVLLVMGSRYKRSSKQEILYKAYKEYSKYLKQDYNEHMIDEESEEGQYHFYNGCHGSLCEHEIDLNRDIPTDIRTFLESNQDKTITFIIHKKTNVFSEVRVSKFTVAERLSFDEDEFEEYMKIEFSLNGTKIYIYDQEKENYVEITPTEVRDENGEIVHKKDGTPILAESVPNIRLDYESGEFGMGNFVIVNKGAIFLPYEVTTTMPYYDEGKLKLPKITPSFKYNLNTSGHASILMFGEEETLLENCFQKVTEYSEDTKRVMEEEGNLEINIYNSSCLHSDQYLFLCDKYPEWAEIMIEEIIFEIESDLDKKKQLLYKLKKKGEKYKIKLEELGKPDSMGLTEEYEENLEETANLKLTIKSLEEDYQKIKERYAKRSPKKFHPLYAATSSVSNKRSKHSGIRKKKKKKKPKKTKKPKKEKKKKKKKKKQTKKPKKEKKKQTKKKKKSRLVS